MENLELNMYIILEKTHFTDKWLELFDAVRKYFVSFVHSLSLAHKLFAFNLQYMQLLYMIALKPPYSLKY